MQGLKTRLEWGAVVAAHTEAPHYVEVMPIRTSAPNHPIKRIYEGRQVIMTDGEPLFTGKDRSLLERLCPDGCIEEELRRIEAVLMHVSNINL